jgi:hypothetical protein
MRLKNTKLPIYTLARDGKISYNDEDINFTVSPNIASDVTEQLTLEQVFFATNINTTGIQTQNNYVGCRSRILELCSCCHQYVSLYLYELWIRILFKNTEIDKRGMIQGLLSCNKYIGYND